MPSQPAVDVTGSVSIVYDGCIYNSSCLKTDLSKCGTVIKTGEDPELILYLYRESGMECLKRIQGDFAFALWDGNLRKLILARDRFGIKPLFYYQSERGRFLFSSEIDAILRSNLTDKELDLASLYHYFFLTFCPQPSTIIKKVKSVPPATYVEYDVERDTITTIPYWDIPCTDNKTLLQEEEILEECGRLLTESVRLRSPVNRKVGISLSSGMDSCTIAGFLDKFEPQMNTFTFGFGEKHGHLNEFSLSRLVAEKIGANHQEIRITGKDLLNALPSLARCLDTPTAGAILPYFFLMKAQEFGIQVAFRGDGGNSAFQYLFDEKMPALDKGLSFLRMLPNRMQTSLYNVFDGIFSLAAKRSRGSSTKLQGLFGLLSRYFSLMAGTVNFASMYSERERGGFFKLTDWMNNKEFRGTRDIVLSYFNTNVRDLHERYNYGDFKVYLDQGLTHLGSLSRSLSIDLRLPYFDHVLIEFIQRTVPSSLRQKNGIDKYILKKIAEPVLPPEIINKNSRGFYMPFKEWLMTDLRPVVDDVFSRSTVDSRGIFNYKKVRTIYDRFYSREDSDISWRKIWAFVILEYWFREHIDEKNN
ncbi:MAG: hypothetical protein JW882_20865 [Deltaproteobacteria bacterium]|nr:hypothetical protein [Deltaproteobacteria bacterium]